jgi:hypothetical protein
MELEDAPGGGPESPCLQSLTRTGRPAVTVAPPTEGAWAAGQGTFLWNNMNHKPPGQGPRHDRSESALFHSHRPSPAR